MATRGTAILIMENLIKEGPEFNGDMYPHGHGDEFLSNLAKDVSNENDFGHFTEDFNAKHFGYEKLKYTEHTHDELKNENNIIGMREIYNSVTSDWVFVKNITSKSVKLQVLDIFHDPDTNEQYSKNILVRPGEAIRVNFGILVANGKGHRITAPK